MCDTVVCLTAGLHSGLLTSVQSLDRLGRRGGHEGQFRRDPLPVFSAGDPCEQIWHGQGRPFFDAVHPAFPRPTMAWPTLQGALKDGFGEDVVACDVARYRRYLLLLFMLVLLLL